MHMSVLMSHGYMWTTYGHCRGHRMHYSCHTTVWRGLTYGTRGEACSRVDTCSHTGTTRAPLGTVRAPLASRSEGETV